MSNTNRRMRRLVLSLGFTRGPLLRVLSPLARVLAPLPRVLGPLTRVLARPTNPALVPVSASAARYKLEANSVPV